MNNAQRAVLAQMLERVKTRIGSAPTKGERLWLGTYVLEPLGDVLEIETLQDWTCSRSPVRSKR